MSKSAIIAAALILIVIGVTVIRFLVHTMILFMEISAVFIIVILVLAWLLARKSTPPAASRP